MKYVALATFLFFLNVSMAFVNASGLFVFQYANADEEWMGQVDEPELADESYATKNVQGESSDWGLLGDFVKGLWFFIKTFGMGVLNFGGMLSQFGLKYPFTWLLNLCVYVIYLLGLAQYIGNKNISTMS